MIIYPDVSILIAATLREESTELAWNLLKRSASVDRLVSSDWALTEAASALAIKQRTGQIAKEERRRVIGAIRELLAASFSLLTAEPNDFRAATRFIERSTLPLRGGDSLHLAIADANDATLWTLDRKMAAAGDALGLDVRLLGQS